MNDYWYDNKFAWLSTFLSINILLEDATSSLGHQKQGKIPFVHATDASEHVNWVSPVTWHTKLHSVRVLKGQLTPKINFADLTVPN